MSLRQDTVYRNETHSIIKTSKKHMPQKVVKISNCDICNHLTGLYTCIDILVCNSCLRKVDKLGPRKQENILIVRRTTSLVPLVEFEMKEENE